MKSWRIRSALVCGTISLLACAAILPAGRAQEKANPKPAIALPDPADLAQWQTWTNPLGWLAIAPSLPAGGGEQAGADTRVQALETAVLDAVKKGQADPSRLYLAGRGDAAALVFYTISRVPDLWAAAVAVGGSPQPAIDSDRFYAANFSNVPVLWIGAGSQDAALARTLAEAGLSFDRRSTDKVPLATVLDWLAGHARQQYPPAVDCETNSPRFARCYWIRMTKFDAGERNDVLPSSHIAPALRPALDLGGFGYKLDDPGPGVSVTFLPEKYSGPLRLGDRITALDGKPIGGARAFAEMLSGFKEERPATVMLQRGKERMRLETSILLPKRVPAVTARVQAKFDPQEKEIQIISRTVTEIEVTVPPQWTPAVLTWNGVALENLEPNRGEPRCLLLRIEKELENAGPCLK